MRLSLALVALVTWACQGPPPQFAGGVLAPLDIEGGRLLVSAKLDGQPRTLVLDTGASITSISTATARDLGIETTGEMAINNHISAKLGVLKSLSIGLADHADVPVAIVDMPNARDSAVKFHGILGLDVLMRHDVVLDFGHHTLALYPPGTTMTTPRGPNMALIEFQHAEHGLMVFEIAIGNHPPIPAILDLGAPTSVINGPAAQLLGIKRPVFHPPALDVGGVALVTRYMLVRDLQTFQRFGLADRPAVLLGSDVFKNKALVIAYRDRIAFLSR